MTDEQWKSFKNLFNPGPFKLLMQDLMNIEKLRFDEKNKAIAYLGEKDREAIEERKNMQKWIDRALEADKEGFLSPEESQAVLEEVKNDNK